MIDNNEMVTIIVNGEEISAPKGIPLIEALDKHNVRVPRLCHHSDFYKNGVTGTGACGLCVIKNNATGKIIRSCLLKTMNGLNISTTDKDCKDARKTAMQLILANHPLECLSCIRNQKCELQSLAAEMGIYSNPYTPNPMHLDYEKNSLSIEINPNKCIKCGRCVITCKTLQQVQALEIADNAYHTYIRPIDGLKMTETPCISCGQCTAHCPVAGVYESSSIEEVKELLEDNNIHTVVQIAPAVRVALGEEFGLEPGTLVTGKIYAALRRLGFDRIFDTNFGADLTILEEAGEFSKRFITEPHRLPVITSCCPSWVNYCEKFYPDLIDHLSSAKSPHQMLGAMVKSYYIEKEGLKIENVKSISIMPCTAKKTEIQRHEDMFVNDGHADVDYVLTTRELARMIKAAGINFLNLEEEEADTLMGEYSGAGTIFGTTGGVMEAALRTAYYNITGSDLPDTAVEFTQARGMEKNKTASIEINDASVNIAVAHGMINVKKILDQVREAKEKNEKQPFDFIEIMACYSGCIGGGGQPYTLTPDETKLKRSQGLYTDDKNSVRRRSHNNPMIVKLYDEYLGKPLEGKAHHLLHTHYAPKKIIRTQAER